MQPCLSNTAGQSDSPLPFGHSLAITLILRIRHYGRVGHCGVQSTRLVRYLFWILLVNNVDAIYFLKSLVGTAKAFDVCPSISRLIGAQEIEYIRHGRTPHLTWERYPTYIAFRDREPQSGIFGRGVGFQAYRRGEVVDCCNWVCGPVDLFIRQCFDRAHVFIGKQQQIPNTPKQWPHHHCTSL